MKYRFLIYISYRYSIPVGIPLEKEILKKGYEVKWFADVAETKEYIITKSFVLNNINEVLDYEPDIVLCITNIVPDFITGLKVQVFHGFNAQKRPSKKNKFSHFRIRGFFDLYCTQGPSTTVFFKKQALKHPHFEVVETGWSKVDPLFPLEDNKKDTFPNILIASTFTPRLSLAHNNEVFKEISRLATTGNYHFNMVLHPKMDSEILTKWKSLNGRYFTFRDTVDLIPLYKKAHILFADTTSAIQEFVLQKKPAVVYNNSTSESYLIHVTEIEKLKSLFDRALQYPSEIISIIETSINKFHPYFDGKSSERIIKACIYSIHMDKSHISNKPLNVIRKYKIRKKLKYFTLKTYSHPFTLKKN